MKGGLIELYRGALKDERGLMAIWGVFILLFFLMFAIWICESGRMLTDNVKVRTAADAASLAGAETAVVTPTNLQLVPDGNGGYKFVSNGWQITIDQQQADAAAKKLVAVNLPSDSTGDTFQSWVDSTKNEYEVFLTNVHIPSLLAKFLGEQLNLGATSYTGVATE
jgi:Flp pilus assembly protein TadG